LPSTHADGTFSLQSYVLKLFRDYVFHSVDEVGNPVLDLTHVLLALNKVGLRERCSTRRRAGRLIMPPSLASLQTDASLDEKIMLVARDEQSCLVVSYREIRNSIEKAYM
jgi:PAB-dependent poly(A)-specific ribonuclease subunit 3